ncbi:glycosyltransferase family 2 protein [Maricaulaceae bacterium MS644]
MIEEKRVKVDPSAKRAKVSFVIAVYFNETALTVTHDHIKALFRDRLPEYEYEIVFVDDGSLDNSLSELLEIKEQDPNVTVLTFTRNFGQAAAMAAGFHHATGDMIVNVSADLQDPIELVEQMVEQWRDGAEVVVAHRVSRNDPLSSKLLSWLAYGLIRLSIPQMPAGGFDYVLIDRRVMDAYNDIPARNRFIQGDLLWLGYRVALIPYARRERTIGRSRYNFWKKLKNFLDALLDASYLPIRFISVCGVITAFLGFLWGISVIIAYLVGATPPEGWAALMIALLLVGGMIMLMLGIIGEYVWRIFDQVRGKPPYVIRRKY